MGLALSLALASLSGILYFLGFVGFGVHPLIWICFVPVLLALRNTSLKNTVIVGAVFGLVTNLGGYYWVIHLLKEFAHLNTPLSFIGYVLLCLYQGSLLALVLLLVYQARKHFSLPPVWTLPVAFVAAEKFYPLLFPSYIGNSLYQLTFITQFVDITGMLGLTALICLVNGAIYEGIESRLEKRPIHRLRIAIPAALILVVLTYGAYTSAVYEQIAKDSPKLEIGMIQTNLGARDKAAKRSEFIQRHVQMSKALVAEHPDLDLLIWPESAYNAWVDRKNTRQLVPLLKDISVPILLGTLTYEGRTSAETKKYNSAILVDKRGEIQQIFDKVILLAFGETIPFVETFPIIKKWIKGVSVFNHGTSFKHFEIKSGISLLPMICYEDIIPGFVRQMWQASGPATALVNLTNDSWYGDTHEPLIHLVLASFRSIETRRYLIRSTNTGISAIVDNRGQIVKQTDQWQQASLVFDVPIIQTHRSTIYMMAGDVLGWFALGLLLMAAFVVYRRKR
jgi:apolipoprotein N-acyltransferase